MLHTRLLTVLGAGIGVLFFAAAAMAQPAAEGESTPPQSAASQVQIPAGQDLGAALDNYIRQTGVQLIYRDDEVVGLQTQGTDGAATHEAALRELLEGTGLTVTRDPSGAMAVADPSRLPASNAAGQNTVGKRRPGIEEIIVTGQKKEERIQDVPIAISAFTMEDLKTSQIAGGPDLHLQVPNMTFTKTNFTGYSIQIRGIGTQAISATTDPAVAVALNNTPFVRNNFFEQEFYDLERVEVLRGPQGTLYGRNATAGVVNLITNKPQFQEESMVSLDMGNYNSRRWEFMVNKPLVDDQVALRIAGAGTKRDGYATNELTGNPIDGRDLWSGRVSLRFAPTGGDFDLNLMYEHFEEDDDRLRSGKQLCHKDVVTEVGAVSSGIPFGGGFAGPQGTFSQGCERGSLYSDNAFQTPNGFMIPYYLPLGAIFLPNAINGSPYANADQSRDLRVIESARDPEYRAQSDIAELQINYQLTDTLTLDSETAYSKNSIFSLEDFNRFNTAPGAWLQPGVQGAGSREGRLQEGPDGGIFCDPQIGCSDRLVVLDVSSAESEQFSQEFRLSSQFSGPFDFSLGANFLRYDTVDKFYVFSNSFTLAQASFPGSAAGTGPWMPGVSDNAQCLVDGFAPIDPDTVARIAETECFYIDPNPIGSLNDLGHNYFLSKNPYKLKSYAVFGETYWRFTDNLKLTAGLRWSVDKKHAPRIPSQLFASQSTGHPVGGVIEQEWREPTGRLVLDWKPTLDFTDETLVYGSYSHGYKAGGANPPAYRVATRTDLPSAQTLNRKSALKPKTFDAEFVDAFEVGTKNTLADGALTVNLTAFYYDYEGYQISEIVDRAAFNRNFDAEVWGAELETDWWARENLKLGLKAGYQKTRIADGEQAIDLMDRTAGRDDWVVVRPFPTFPSSCVLPAYVYYDDGDNPTDLALVSGVGGGNSGGCEIAYQLGFDPLTVAPYEANPTECGDPDFSQPPACSLGSHDNYIGFDPLDESQGHNGGEGFFKDLGGNEFPNAPHYTVTVTGDYIIPLKGDWLATLHTDIYWQSKSWWRIFNDHEFNRIDDYFTMNLAAIFANERSGWDIMAYVKNVTDEDALTGAFLYSDDVGLTTNAFLVEPRTAGIRVTKHWDGGGPAGWLGGAGAALLEREPGEPNPWELTVGGHLLRPNDAPVEKFEPAFISSFDPNIDPSREQGEDLDWGDSREVVLTYAPESGWRFSLGTRWGQANKNVHKTFKGQVLESCRKYAATCEPGGGPLFPGAPANFISPYVQPERRTNYGLTDLTEMEEHLLVDFTVGRDVGLGSALNGTLSAGLRYASFESSTDVSLRGTPNWNLPEQCWSVFNGGVCFSSFPFGQYANPATRDEFQGTMKAEREFEGVGPIVGWEASSRLLGDDSGGRLDLDWSLSGGVLFGRQDTSVEGFAAGQYFVQYLEDQKNEGDSEPDASYSNSFSYDRDTDAAVVPTLGAGLGLTYRIDGFSIGAGYNWERYFDAIDGGIAERKEYDRTIDGPYLKVTFGGGS